MKPNSLEEVTDLNLKRIIDMCLKQKAQDRYRYFMKEDRVYNVVLKLTFSFGEKLNSSTKFWYLTPNLPNDIDHFKHGRSPSILCAIVVATPGVLLDARIVWN